jgi:hypothetical protein
LQTKLWASKVGGVPIFNKNGLSKVKIFRYSSDSVEIGYKHEASCISFITEMDNKYIIEREANEGDKIDFVVVAIECATKIQYTLKKKINFVEHVYGLISYIHFYHAVPFRDLLNLDHKKFYLQSTKENFIARV